MSGREKNEVSILLYFQMILNFNEKYPLENISFLIKVFILLFKLQRMIFHCNN